MGVLGKKKNDFIGDNGGNSEDMFHEFFVVSLLLLCLVKFIFD